VVTPWVEANSGGAEIDSFLEGPSFDRAGNLYVTDIPFGRVFRISPAGEWTLVTEYDGEPNGLKIHKDGRIFITDYRHGIMVLDAASGKIEPFLARRHSESFKGVNDLFFADNGDLYFTDQGQTGIHDPSGRVFRLSMSGRLDRLCDNVPSPNGITLSTTDKHCYVGVTRSQQVWRLPIMADGNISKTGVAIQLSGGVGGPDGIEMDSENGLLVCQLGVGIWRFDSNMLPTHLIHSPDHKHHHLANIAAGGPDLKTLYITESLSGDILVAKLPVAGKKLFAHQ
jgi:gluconolactonase